MSTENEYQSLRDRVAALREAVTNRFAGDLVGNPALADALKQQIAQLIGVGPEAADELGRTRIPQGVEPYDEQITSERLVAVGDLYYIYQHEKIGVFRTIRKLKELFHAGAVRLSSGQGAFLLYQFDRRDVLRYTLNDRLAAYRRAFGYGNVPVPQGTTPNVDFHNQFSHFINQVALFWRDKRISDVVRERAYDPSFGSIAIVRRAGLDLRNNLKFSSFGHINVLRVEVMQLLEEAFKILGAEDVRSLFGTDNAWDTVEEILVRYYNERLVTSPRQRMGVAGREVLRWLAQPHIMKMQRGQFEALLLQIAEFAEEWLTSAQSMGLARRMEANRVLPWGNGSPAAVASPGTQRRAARRVARGRMAQMGRA
jgi:hypothetical protein